MTPCIPAFSEARSQAGVIGEFIDRFGSDDGRGGTPLVLVDPVLGDDGELYHTITPALTDAMRRLCIRADVITPNITEACLLSGMSYGDALAMSDSDPERLGRLLTSDLICLGGRLRRAVVTGIRCDGGKSIATASYDAADGSFALHKQERVGRDYPGTAISSPRCCLADCFAARPLPMPQPRLHPLPHAVPPQRSRAAAESPRANGVALEPLLGSLSGGIPAGKNL